ncbi:MAG TPA: 2-C-methyl-D-erythritol 2,4-cyclodiphosphate synthase [Myxococcota bacterium]|jgi:2-C-methyl-D-erythritol 2,4-cyclodiphosphate synthase|nr:2-C-methyl-D-erythritol 2,4-cyclodiphosphate synthase [Myxococcota bacterium]
MEAPRIGTGFDVHRLVEGRPLVLGGVDIPSERGLAGNSDADVLTHAVAGALLGAAALGDIGQHFPAEEARWKDARSLELLAHVVRLLGEAGLRVGNVDATVICERPRLAPHVAAMRAALAGVLGIGAEAVSVKATTTEGLGATGRGEGIAAQAVALVTRVARRRSARAPRGESAPAAGGKAPPA